MVLWVGMVFDYYFGVEKKLNFVNIQVICIRLDIDEKEWQGCFVGKKFYVVNVGDVVSQIRKTGNDVFM